MKRVAWIGRGLVLGAVLAGASVSTRPLAAQTGGMGADPAVEKDVERIRSSTKAFKSLDAAVAAGYARDGGSCIAHQGHGAMGYHHVNQALMDGKIEVERPEILVYEKLPNGEYRLNGVEYIIPFSILPETAEPPVVMGQKLKPAPGLKIWYRHVWVWLENPSGLFEDWNPRVKC